jgi:hypothetical protein
MSLAADFAPVHDGHVRLTMLRLLDAQPSYCANDSIMHQAVNAMGLACSRDQLRGHLTWLEEQRLVTCQAVATALVVATLTERGSDVANGRSVIPGVQRPSPRG